MHTTSLKFQPVVDAHPSYPSKHYKLAWWELIDRYAIPKAKAFFGKKSESVDPDQQVLNGIHKKGKKFNPGFDQLKEIADSLNIPLVVYLHAEKGELQAGKYNEQGDEIMAWAAENNINLIKDMDMGLSEDDFRDNIHLSVKGQRKLAKILEEIFP